MPNNNDLHEAARLLRMLSLGHPCRNYAHQIAESLSPSPATPVAETPAPPAVCDHVWLPTQFQAKLAPPGAERCRCARCGRVEMRRDQNRRAYR